MKFCQLMKPCQLKAERERRARVALRKVARRIPDNAALANLLLDMDRPLRENFYRVIRPHLKFSPIPLEVLNK